MGHAVAAVLRQGGLRVISQLDGRSQRTRALADRAGIEEVADDTTLVREAEIVLAILVPAQAIALAERIARAIAASGARPLYVDCNAIAPQTTRQIAEIIEGAGARFVDAGIIGPPPKPGAVNHPVLCLGARCRGVRPARRLRAGCACGRRSAGSGVRAQDVLRRTDQGHDGAHDAALGGGGAARRQRGPERGVRAEPAGDARAHAARGAGDGAQGAPLGRRDGGDREDVRSLRPDAAHVPGRG